MVAIQRIFTKEGRALERRIQERKTQEWEVEFCDESDWHSEATSAEVSCPVGFYGCDCGDGGDGCSCGDGGDCGNGFSF